MTVDEKTVECMDVDADLPSDDESSNGTESDFNFDFTIQQGSRPDDKEEEDEVVVEEEAGGEGEIPGDGNDKREGFSGQAGPSGFMSLPVVPFAGHASSSSSSYSAHVAGSISVGNNQHQGLSATPLLLSHSPTIASIRCNAEYDSVRTDLNVELYRMNLSRMRTGKGRRTAVLKASSTKGSRQLHTQGRTRHSCVEGFVNGKIETAAYAKKDAAQLLQARLQRENGPSLSDNRVVALNGRAACIPNGPRSSQQSQERTEVAQSLQPELTWKYQGTKPWTRLLRKAHTPLSRMKETNESRELENRGQSVRSLRVVKLTWQYQGTKPWTRLLHKAHTPLSRMKETNEPRELETRGQSVRSLRVVQDSRYHPDSSPGERNYAQLVRGSRCSMQLKQLGTGWELSRQLPVEARDPASMTSDQLFNENFSMGSLPEQSDIVLV
ncbi:hypothetical protein BKA70DRAFT_1237402 [Coprinopsis sp. MPI-PUGE-AT-0042]|nr:hypothetical protein BKA70DRAFT_1237402 [Coprinopsis sp. MPI-PUGE-AT-0042]